MSFVLHHVLEITVWFIDSEFI